MRIGVFDSGRGGLSVARAVEKAFPDCEIEFMSDQPHMPYGLKAPSELLQLVTPILQDLASRCEVIVIACNTVTTTIIGQLRVVIAVPLIGIEPMVKPAAQLTKSKVIAVCATPTTLGSPRYAELKQLYAKQLKVLEPDCSDWAYMIEHNKVSEEKIGQRIEAACQASADVIVLGCTHYHWIEQLIKDIADNRATVIQPEPAIIRRLQQFMAGY